MHNRFEDRTKLPGHVGWRPEDKLHKQSNIWSSLCFYEIQTKNEKLLGIFAYDVAMVPFT
jgi:hypothetical protein